jgi:SAM-dependent methyltransferase
MSERRLRSSGNLRGRTILDVGCGNNKASAAWGIDLDPGSQADVICDLNHYPWPLADGQFAEILCNHILEHVDDVMLFAQEAHRVASPGALVKVVTPHYTSPSSFADPSHRHHFAAGVPDFLADRCSPRFAKVSVHLCFGRLYRCLGIEALANYRLSLYEPFFAFLFPARDLHFTLRVIK